MPAVLTLNDGSVFTLPQVYICVFLISDSPISLLQCIKELVVLRTVRIFKKTTEFELK